MTTHVDGHTIVGEFLAARSVGDAFGLLGDANVNPIVHAEAHGVRFHPAWHEACGITMAAGYALTTGRIGVATVTKGPGLTNSVTALTSAVRDRAPIVLLAGATARTDAHAPQSPAERFEPQEIDHEGLARLTGAAVCIPSAVSDLLHLLPQAFDAAARDRRPQVILLPVDVMRETIARDDVRFPDAATVLAAPSPVPADDDVDAAVALLAGADRPIVLCGLGATDPTTIRAASAIAERLGALLTTTLPAAGMFPADPYALGPAGGYAVALTRELMGSADAVLAIGASLNPFTTDRGALFSEARVVQVDVDAAAIGRQHPVEIGLVGDAGSVTTTLLRRLEELGIRREGLRTPDVAHAIAARGRYQDLPDRSDELGVDPRSVLRAVDDAVDLRRRVVVDVGHFSTFPTQVLRINSVRGLLPAFGLAAVGLGLGTAIGAAIGNPDETVIAVVGDGGMAMALGDLEVAAASGARLIVVVLNDAAYGAEVHMLRRDRLPEGIVQFRSVDFAAIARGMGMDAITVREPADLPGARAVIAAATGPLLVDARVTPRVVADKFQRLAT